jgi:drug/metabolite transporter (DMT)-like permease
MGSIVLVLLAALLAALSNLIFRKFSDREPSLSYNGFLACSYFFNFAASFILFPELAQQRIHPIVVEIGSCVGVLSVLLMLVTATAFKKGGPAGPVYVFQNVSSVFPGVLLLLLFGTRFGFSISLAQWIGIALVLGGLYLSAQQPPASTPAPAQGPTQGPTQGRSSSWLPYAIAGFLIQVLSLTLIQGRCVLFQEDKLPEHLACYALSASDDLWFLPCQYGASLLLQIALFIKEKRAIRLSELIYGFCNGIPNFTSSYLLLLATKWASPHETAILLPCFCVTVILLCNLWANRLYGEKFNIASNTLSTAGVLLGILG